VAAESKKGTGVCLVDHNQLSQMTAGIDPKSIRGVIDHHALQAGTVVTDSPIYVNIRAWGSACTIVTHMAVSQNRIISKKTAVALLCGILSDTLNLCSPTTTEADKLIVALLAQLGDVSDANLLAQNLFKAKSRDLATMSSHALLRGDLKRFAFENPAFTAEIAFGVVETTDLDALITKREELLMEMRALKKEDDVNLVFLALVDIVRLHSVLLICGSNEADLAIRTFGGTVSLDGTMDLGKRVSRKKDFIPPMADQLANGWTPPPMPTVVEQAMDGGDEEFGEVYMDCNAAHGCMIRRKPSSGIMLAATALRAAAKFMTPRSAVAVIDVLASAAAGARHHHEHDHASHPPPPTASPTTSFAAAK